MAAATPLTAQNTGGVFYTAVKGTTLATGIMDDSRVVMRTGEKELIGSSWMI
jgi:hypothetical protein